MRDNNKGFTLIEILAAITILAIISTISVIAVTRYVEKTKEKSYETMVQSVCDAANNYIINEGLESEVVDAGSDGITYDAVNLMEDKYLENLMDPNDKERRCGANVNVKLANGSLDDDSISEFSYFVKLRCKNYSTDVGFSHGCIINKRAVDPGSPEPTVPDPIVNPDPGGGGGSNPDPDPGSDIVDPSDPGIVTPGVDTGSSELTCSVLKENSTWTNQVPVEAQVKCIPNGSNACQQEVYTRSFYSDNVNDVVAIYDNAGNSKLCNVKVYIDTEAPSKPVVNNVYDNTWTSGAFSVSLSSTDTVSGIDYFAYRYPNSTVASEREWHKYANSSKDAGDSSVFVTTNFSKERNEIVEFIACDKAGNCSETSSSMIKIDKTAPTCTLFVIKDGPEGKQDTIVTGNCADNLSGCVNDSVQKVFPFMTVSTNTSPGRVYDNAGNYVRCPEYIKSEISTYCELSVGQWTVEMNVRGGTSSSFGMSRDETPVFNGQSSLRIDSGMFYGYVKDADGNTVSCSIDVVNSDDIRYDKSVNVCRRKESSYTCAKKANISYSCDSGYTLSGTECVRTVPATTVKLYNKKTYSCSTVATDGTLHTCDKISNQNKCSSTSGCSWNGTSCIGSGGYCDDGFTKLDTSCKKFSYKFALNGNSVLTSNCVADDGICSSEESRDKITCDYANTTYSCSLGKLSGSQCSISVAAKTNYSCASGYTLVGNKCYKYNATSCDDALSKVGVNYSYSFESDVEKNKISCSVSSAFTCDASNYGKSYVTACTRVAAECPENTAVSDEGYCRGF